MRSRVSEKAGAAIRKLRLARGWNLATLSEMSGVPVSTLSRLELGQNGLNNEKLVRLCHALGVDVDGIVREAEAPPLVSGRRSITRAGDGPRASVGGNSGRRGAADLLTKGLSPLLLDVTVANLEAHGPLAVHGGEAYALVLDGAVVLHSYIYAPLALGVGDAVYFDAASGYALVAPESPAKVLLVASGETSFA